MGQDEQTWAVCNQHTVHKTTTLHQLQVVGDQVVLLIIDWRFLYPITAPPTAPAVPAATKDMQVETCHPSLSIPVVAVTKATFKPTKAPMGPPMTPPATAPTTAPATGSTY